jgi:hypothetical protein
MGRRIEGRRLMKWRRKRDVVERSVAADAARGLAPAAISARQGTPVAEVRKIAESTRDPLEDAANPLDLRGEIERYMTYWNALVEDYTQVFEEADSDSERLRALAGRRQAMLDRLELLVSFGLIPSDPDVWGRVMDERAAVLFARSLMEQGVAREVILEAIRLAGLDARLDSVVSATNQAPRRKRAATRGSKTRS